MKIAFLSFISLFGISFLSAELDDPSISATLKGEPETIVEKCVSSVSGDFFLSEADYVLPGIQPLPLARTFVSSAQTQTAKGEFFFPHIYLYLDFKENKKVQIVTADHDGFPLMFRNMQSKKKNKRTFHIYWKKQRKGKTNTSYGNLSGQNNINNYQVFAEEGYKHVTVRTGDGTERVYKRIATRDLDKTSFTYHLKHERFPNGNYVYYFYRHNILERVQVLSPTQKVCYGGYHFFYQRKKNQYKNVNVCVAPLNEQMEPYPDQIIEYGHHKISNPEYYRGGIDDKYHFCLDAVTKPHRPKTKLSFVQLDRKNRFRPKKVSFGEKLYKDITYYFDDQYQLFHDYAVPTINFRFRVKDLRGPSGENGEPFISHKFVYSNRPNHEILSDVRDANNHKTLIYINCHERPTKIERYENVHHDANYSAEQKLRSTEHFTWANGGWFEGNILCKYFEEKGAIHTARSFIYDERHNVKEDVLYGNLSGTSNIPIKQGETLPENHGELESYTLCYKYYDSPLNLTYEKILPGGVSYRYYYKEGTNLLTHEFLLYKGEILQRTFRIYNKDNILIQEITDDGHTKDPNDLSGITQRLITSIHPKEKAPAKYFPQVVAISYVDPKTQRHHQLQKTVYHYNEYHQTIQSDHYDAEDRYVYSIYKIYDKQQRLISETDPLGRMTTYEYNEYDSPTKIRKADSPCTTYLTYDAANYLIEEKQVAPDGKVHSQKYQYDYLGNKIQSIDPYGNPTSYAYDHLGHQTKITTPNVLVQGQETKASAQKEYDAFGRVIREISPLGHVKKTEYTSYGKPCRVIHPDQSEERYVYSHSGMLKTYTNPLGAQTHYTYDHLQRPISKQIVSKNGEVFQKEKYTYSQFQLLTKTLNDGSTIYYSYDGAGRKIQEKTVAKDGSFISQCSYEYDTLGRVTKTIQEGEHLQRITETTYDLLGRKIEVKEEDGTQLISNTKYRYDPYGNIQEILIYNQQGIAKQTYTYDGFGRQTSETDPLGNTTKITYDEHCINELDQRVLQKTITNPLGTQVIETYDALHRLIEKETRSASGDLLLFEEMEYDIEDRLIAHKHTTYPEDRMTLTKKKYDALGNLIQLIEAADTPQEKITSFLYTKTKQLQKQTNPDGVEITYAYDPLFRKISMKSSDGTINYRYVYNKQGMLQTAKDLIHETQTNRIYNASGDLIEETLQNGLILKKEYDPFHRIKKLILPNSSSMIYSYDAYYLRAVERFNERGQLLHQRSYPSYDLSHNLLEETINNHQNITYEYNPANICVGIYAERFSQKIDALDSCNNPLSVTTEYGTTTYTYDALSQLTSEEGIFCRSYQSDGLQNRYQIDDRIYSINALNQLESPDLHYDKKGNLIQKGDMYLTYDALNRLIQIQTPTDQVRYQYDALNRRVSKITQKGTFYFLYDEQNEMGMTDDTYKIIELRTLKPSDTAEIYSTLFLELYTQTFIPTQDLFGNINSIDDTSYNGFSAYGEESNPNTLNPWRFQSKRHDPETNLVYFGSRYYDVDLGRWISPDPRGLKEHPNLYQFLLNNPLLNLDLYGEAVSPDHYKSIRDGEPTYDWEKMREAAYKSRPHSSINSVYQGNNNRYAANYINGVSTSYDTNIATGEFIRSQFNDNVDMFTVYNSSHGLGDIIDVMGNNLGIPISLNKKVKKQLYYCLENYDKVFVFAHSEAGLPVKRELEAMYPVMGDLMKKKLHIHVLGSAAFIPKKYGKEVVNWVSKRDIVPQVGRFYRENPTSLSSVMFPVIKGVAQFIRPYNSKEYDVRFIEATYYNPIKEHGIMETTYRQQLVEICEDLKRKVIQ